MFLFSTDIDGTIYDGPESALAFNGFWNQLRLENQDRPPLLVYNTGRLYPDTLELIRSTTLPSPDFLISGVGTRIHQFDTGTSLAEWESLLNQDWDVDLVIQIARQVLDGVVPQEEMCQNPHKSSWFWRDRDPSELVPLKTSLLEAGVKTEIIYSSNRDLDILPVNANKGKALKWLSTHLGRPMSKILVAGDSGNDISMFQVDGAEGIVVSNAEDFLKVSTQNDHCFHATQPCAQGVIEGIGNFIQKHELKSDGENQ